MALNKLLRLYIIFIIAASFNLHAQLKSNNNQADYLIITPTQFIKTLQPFIKWRENKNLNVNVIELQQIHSEFQDSTQTSSIRNFISYALTYWSNPKPKYVLLVGGAKLIPSYNVPSMFAYLKDYHEDSVSIDEWYAVNSYESDTAPDIALGRFPIDNEQELNNIISKSIYFEDSLTSKYYPSDFLFLTDKTDSELFEQSANKFISSTLPISFSKNIIFAGQDSTIGTTRIHLIDALNNGTIFLSYYGHGAPDRWSKYNIFDFEDIDSLKVNNLPFIFTAAACDQPFDFPGDSSIVKKLIALYGSGTVASVASTGLNYLTNGSDFLTTFYNNLFSRQDVAIGDAILQTKLQLETYNYSADVIPRRYTLLGDPALKLPSNTITGVTMNHEKIPDSYSLKQNFPNPFNPSTIINYSIPKAGFVTIKIYDLLGREVATPVNEEKQPGNYSVHFDGSELSSEIYFYTLKAGNFYQTKKMILLK